MTTISTHWEEAEDTYEKIKRLYTSDSTMHMACKLKITDRLTYPFTVFLQ